MDKQANKNKKYIPAIALSVFALLNSMPSRAINLPLKDSQEDIIKHSQAILKGEAKSINNSAEQIELKPNTVKVDNEGVVTWHSSHGSHGSHGSHTSHVSGGRW